jgi:ATP/maltotriose-dependent transcriptional regulator MalT
MSFGAGHDTGVCAHGMQGMTLALAGEADRARQSLKTAIELAEQLGHPHSLAHACSLVATACITIDDRRATEEAAQRLLELADKYKFPPHRVTALFYLAWARADESALASSLESMEVIFERVMTIGVHPHLFATMMAELLVRAGRTDEAYRLIERTFREMKEADASFFMPRLLQVRKSCCEQMADGKAMADFSAAAARLVQLHETRLAGLKAAAAQGG